MHGDVVPIGEELLLPELDTVLCCVAAASVVAAAVLTDAVAALISR